MPGVNESNEYYREEWSRLHTQKHLNKSFAKAGYAQFHVLTKASYWAKKQNQTKQKTANKQCSNEVIVYISKHKSYWYTTNKMNNYIVNT